MLSGQGIHGVISDPAGMPVPFTHIYVPAINKGTTSNAEGVYKLPLPTGMWKVEFRNIGYNTFEQELQIEDADFQLDVALSERSYRIGEIKVLASGEDPAMYIMRRAIAMAPYYKSQVFEYTSSVYLKGTGKFAKIPRMFRKTLEKQGVRTNDVFSIESLSKVEFRLPDQLKQEILAQRSSGNDNNTSPMPMITSNLYNASGYGVVSPFDRQALQVYQFRLLGMFEDQGRMINRIQVTPRRRGNDVFEGIINVADGYWSVHSADLKLSAPMMQIRMKQLYGPVDLNTWMPVSLNFDIVFEGMGFGLDYIYVASISEYQVKLNPKLDHSFIEKQRQLYAEEMQILEKDAIPGTGIIITESGSRRTERIQELLQKDELSSPETRQLNRLLTREAASTVPPPPLEIEQRIFMDSVRVERDSSFWEAVRPIPLSGAEARGFERKDSIMRIRSSPEYRDSVELIRKRFKAQHLLLGATYSYHPQGSATRNTLTVPRAFGFQTVTYNTVDGVRLNLPFEWYRRDTLGQAFTLSPLFSYAFSRKKIDATVSADYTWNGAKMAVAGISGGSATVDYNQETGLARLSNELHTLWFEWNYKKFIRRDFIEIYQQYEVVNGFTLKTTFSWADRQPLDNNAFYRIIDWKNRSFTENVPANSTLTEDQLMRSRSAEITLNLTYTPGQRYYLRNGFKYYAGFDRPTFSATWRRAVPGIFGSDARYEYVEAGVRQRITAGMGNIFRYKVNAGAFLDNYRLHFSDFRHFSTHYPKLITNPDFVSFRLNPFYRASTDAFFAESHASFESGRILVKRIPILANTMITEQLFVHLLHNNHYRYYAELGYGISNIFAVFSLEVVAGFEKGKFMAAGVKLGLNLPGLTGD